MLLSSNCAAVRSIAKYVPVAWRSFSRASGCGVTCWRSACSQCGCQRQYANLRRYKLGFGFRRLRRRRRLIIWQICCSTAKSRKWMAGGRLRRLLRLRSLARCCILGCGNLFGNREEAAWRYLYRSLLYRQFCWYFCRCRHWVRRSLIATCCMRKLHSR